MKANELRIGNWVLRNNKPVKIVADKFLPIALETLGKDYIKPIPLTEEWLVKFGFIWGSYTHGWKIKNSDEKIIIEKDFRLSSGIFNIKIKHVHQLQNLYFALTNTELELKSK